MAKLIPGLRPRIDTVVNGRLSAIARSAEGERDDFDRKSIVHAYDGKDDEWVMDQCPFHEVIDAYPGTADFRALYDWYTVFDHRMSDGKELNAWANNVINAIRNELWPRKVFR
jgi:hypothetical protein